MVVVGMDASPRPDQLRQKDEWPWPLPPGLFWQLPVGTAETQPEVEKNLSEHEKIKKGLL
jgi:hypothetical protein